MSFWNTACIRCKREFLVHDEVQIITVGDVYMVDVPYGSGDKRVIHVRENRVLVCKEPCV